MDETYENIEDMIPVLNWNEENSGQWKYFQENNENN
tara:strand:+ start:49 stop:156 length:108 start_codon:yes stop_codon:yes gene_type:complete